MTITEDELLRLGRWSKLERSYKVALVIVAITAVAMVTLSVVALGVTLHTLDEVHTNIDQIKSLTKGANQYTKGVAGAAHNIAEKLTAICAHLPGCK